MISQFDLYCFCLQAEQVSLKFESVGENTMINIIRTRRTFDFTGEMRLAGDRELFNYKAKKIDFSDLYLFTFTRAGDENGETRAKTILLDKVTPEKIRRAFAFISWDDLARNHELRFDAIDMGIEDGENYEEVFRDYKSGKREGKIIDTYPSFGGAYSLISNKADSIILTTVEDGRCTGQYALCFSPITKRRTRKATSAKSGANSKAKTRSKLGKTASRTDKTAMQAKKRVK